MSAEDVTTRAATKSVDDGGPTVLPCLTIAAHRDLRRVGDRAVLHLRARGRGVRLSRNEPDFACPGVVLGAPLEDAHVSRSPVLLHGDGAGVVVIDRAGSRMKLQVAGQELGERAELAADLLADGVDLVLGDSVALILHEIVADDRPAPPSYGLVGSSGPLTEVRRAIERVADLEVPVLLRGESGTGKELVARAVHDAGGRRGGPFVAVNLSAVTPSLAAAELFGTVKGAYTGAVSRMGFFGAADGGTLFLDEVGECPADVQTMLLRALDMAEFFPVGSHTAKRADVRLVAATDSDLEAKSRTGAFKEPLLHRLSAYEVWLPPLRERREDIGRLLVHFALGPWRQARGDGRRGEGPPADWIPADLVARLCRYHWPGNVRQLRNLVWQLVIDSRDRPRLTTNPRVERLLEEPPARDEPTGDRRPAELDDTEVESALADCGWDVAAAARHLGISRPSLYERINKSPSLRTAQDLDKEEIEAALESSGGDVDRTAEALKVSARGLRRRMSQLGVTG